MHDVPLLGSLVVIFSVTLPISYIFHRLHCPAVVGYLLAGVFIGPHALGFVKDSEEIHLLSEIGVVLLMFTIGMELSLSTLLKNLRTVVGSGFLQVLANLVFFALVNLCLGFSLKQSIFFGLLLAISSTAVVLKAYSDRAELDTYHGQICAGVLLFQDLLVIPIMLAAPFLTGQEDLVASEFAMVVFKSVLGIGAIFLVSKLAVPRLLSIFIKLKDREMMLLLIILICMLGAWGAQEIGLTLAMGAFIVGLILSESEYCHDLVNDILPFRDFFSSLFFISVGMMLQLSFLVDHLGLVFGGTLALLVCKGALNSISVYILERSWYRSVVSGARLAQVGEFSFVVIGTVVGSPAIPNEIFQAFLCTAILTMLVTPFLMPLSIMVARKVIRIDASRLPDAATIAPKMKDHVIIVGYDNIGQYLARILQETRIPFIVVDQDHETISAATSQGLKAVYGDVARGNILDLCGLRTARALVYTKGQSNVVKGSTLHARSVNRSLYILVMSGSTQEVVDYLSIGVNRVISSEFETTVEMFSRILNVFDIPDNIIQHFIEMARMEGYGMFRGIKVTEESMQDFYSILARSTTITHMVVADSPLVGRKFSEIDIHQKTGAVVISVVRGQNYFSSPDGSLALEPNDLLVLVGAHRQLDKAKKLLEAKAED